jgi:hypothetical protein
VLSYPRRMVRGTYANQKEPSAGSYFSGKFVRRVLIAPDNTSECFGLRKDSVVHVERMMFSTFVIQNVLSF